MTEQEWLTGTEPLPVLEYIRSSASERKLRLFACVFLRTGFSQLPDKRSRQILATVEKYAEGLVGAEKLRAAWGSARWAAQVAGRQYDGTEGIRWLLAHATEANEPFNSRVAWYVVYAGGGFGDQASLCHLLRDLFGNPFRPIAIDPAWLTWHDATVAKLAQAAYDERNLPSGELDRVRLAVLADALEEAGCTTAEIVEHLRSPGPHVRGCWVVDRLLGKE